ncbi:hypothetical protein M758_11G128300 [Ceratodon purpureus]|nr:hypothetical protein M758_11G128300 [Ceratodon purpureus]
MSLTLTISFQYLETLCITMDVSSDSRVPSSSTSLLGRPIGDCHNNILKRNGNAKTMNPWLIVNRGVVTSMPKTTIRCIVIVVPQWSPSAPPSSATTPTFCYPPSSPTCCGHDLKLLKHSATTGRVSLSLYMSLMTT